MNKAMVIGNLTRDPEDRLVNAPDGVTTHTVCNFTVAVNRVAKGQKLTEYFWVSCWNKQAENAMKYLAKGSKVAVMGPVSARGYIAQDGNARAQMEITAEDIEYLSGRPQGGMQDAPQEAAPRARQEAGAYYQQGQFMPIPDDGQGLPFR